MRIFIPMIWAMALAGVVVMADGCWRAAANAEEPAARPVPVDAVTHSPAETAAHPPDGQEAPPPGAQDPALEENFTGVELDQFIQQEQRITGDGKKRLTMARPVSFEARMKRGPEEREMGYIYEALQVIGVSPLPKVHHRMFIESDEGRIMPVYVEEQVAARLLDGGVKKDERAHFRGYHVYSYSKGPAILVVDFATL